MPQPIIAFYLVTILSSCGFLWIAMRRTRLEKSILFFAIFIFFIVAWQITLFLFYLLTSQPTVYWLGKFNFAVIATAMTFLFYFAIAFHNENKTNKWIYLVTGLESVVLVLVTLFSRFIDSNEIIKGANRITEYGTLYYWFIAHFLGYIICAAIILTIRSQKLTKLAQVQVKYLIAGIIIAASTGAITNIFIPLIIQDFYIQNFGGAAAFLLIGFSTYAMMRHSLFNSKIILTELLVVMLLLVGLAQLIIASNLWFFALYLLILILLVIVGMSLMRSVLREYEAGSKIKTLNDNLLSTNVKLEGLAVNLKEANTHLKELMEIKTEFLHIASHQLRTPLTSMRGLLEMQAHGDFEKLTEEKRKAIQKDMLSGVNQLNNIVNDLLDAMELEGGNLNFKLEQIQAEDVIEEAIKTLKFNYEKKGLKLIFEKPANPMPKMECDAEYLRQVFLNIIDNAEKYTREGGTTIRIAKKAKNIEVTFTDTGIGIDPEERSKLFGKFVRGSRSQNIHTDGTGLGLFIIKKIVEEHHGRVLLESEGVGKGTTFRVILPISQPK